jgi:hypothetical protein
MLLYKLLGEKAEAEFARGWAISYAMGAVTEWRPIVEEAIKAAIIMAILERLLLTRHSNWLEVRLSLCGTVGGFAARLNMLVHVRAASRRL